MKTLPDDVVRKIASKMTVANKERTRAATKDLRRVIDPTEENQDVLLNAVYGFNAAIRSKTREMETIMREAMRIFQDLMDSDETASFVLESRQAMRKDYEINNGLDVFYYQHNAPYLVVLLGQETLLNFVTEDLPRLNQKYQLDTWMARVVGASRWPDNNPVDEEVLDHAILPAIALASNADAMRALDVIRPKLQTVVALHQEMLGVYRQTVRMEKQLMKNLNKLGNVRFALYARAHYFKHRRLPRRWKLAERWDSRVPIQAAAPGMG
jgi:hypothetical protein